jgi:hypothetical protein
MDFRNLHYLERIYNYIINFKNLLGIMEIKK